MTAQGPSDFPIQAPFAPFRYAEALEAVRGELAAMPADSLAPPNVDVPAAVLIVLGAVPAVGKLRDELVALPGFDAAAFDKLETYALAAGHAHTLFHAASQPMEPVPVMVEELMKTRERLELAVRALADAGLIDGSRLGEVKGGTGHKAVAFDVMMLCTLFRASWSVVSERTAIDEVFLLRAETVADRLATALAMKDRGRENASEAADLRQRAFAKLAKVYDQARRAISYVRWETDDADRIAPSIYTKGTRRRTTEEDASTPPVVPALPVPAQATPGNGTAAPVGLPGSAPFTR